MNNYEHLDAESQRLAQEVRREKNWKRWGPYLAERQWGTVREDYSLDGSSWDYFPHSQARSRAYRWGEDGLLGICVREGRLCFALAMWNEHDPILKERLFGLSNAEGNHGEDVKEYYFYLDSTPTHSYLKALYKYPQSEFPYTQLVEENRDRSKAESEFELVDTGIFALHRYFDITVEYAKANPNDILIRIAITNRSSQAATLHLLPTVWFKNTWSWGRTGESYWAKPRIEIKEGQLLLSQETLGHFRFVVESLAGGGDPEFLFTDNETNVARLFGGNNPSLYVKDAFHDYLIEGRQDAINPDKIGTKAAAHYRLELAAGETSIVRARLFAETEIPAECFGEQFDQCFARRIQEANEFYQRRIPPNLSASETQVARQAYAGLLWSKQFFHYGVKHWLEGDPTQPLPARQSNIRNQDWANHLYNRDVISMPDKWEYPWYASWDLAFHLVALAKIDPDFAKQQAILFLREWYMHPNGEIPAYEFDFSDTTPPLHAWACWRIYKITGEKGQRDQVFLARVFQKLLLNFTWWVNRKDIEGKNLFSGGFLGMDNIGVFDRSKPLPAGGHLQQADGTAFMAF